MEMAEDAALGWLLTSLEDGSELPKASDIGNVKLEDGGFVNLFLINIVNASEKYSK